MNVLVAEVSVNEDNLGKIQTLRGRKRSEQTKERKLIQSKQTGRGPGVGSPP